MKTKRGTVTIEIEVGYNDDLDTDQIVTDIRRHLDREPLQEQVPHRHVTGSAWWTNRIMRVYASSPEIGQTTKTIKVTPGERLDVRGHLYTVMGHESQAWLVASNAAPR